MAANMSFRVRRKNGTEFHVHVVLGPVPTPDGICTIAVIRQADETGRHGRLAVDPC